MPLSLSAYISGTAAASSKIPMKTEEPPHSKFSTVLRVYVCFGKAGPMYFSPLKTKWFSSGHVKRPSFTSCQVLESRTNIDRTPQSSPFRRGYRKVHCFFEPVRSCKSVQDQYFVANKKKSNDIFFSLCFFLNFPLPLF